MKLILEFFLTFHYSCRFDLIYLILDKADEQTDRRLAKHIVSLHFENPEVLYFFHSFIFQSFLIDYEVFVT